ncbi:hypothetical protein RI054_16g74850 [Pseudoscourfieldia marina]
MADRAVYDKPRDDPTRTRVRAKGDVYQQDCTMDSQQYQKMFLELVIPAVREKMPWARRVVIQHDGASPHTGKGTEDVCRAGGERTSMSWEPSSSRGDRLKVDLVRQPANSPDFNVLDLCFNRSLAVIVGKYHARSKAQIAAAVEAAWSDYDCTKIERAFEYKTLVCKAVVRAKGWNNYTLPHRRDLVNGELPKLSVDELPYIPTVPPPPPPLVPPPPPLPLSAN